jgi:hypothetical protein
MEFGIADYRPEDAAIAQAMGARWARIRAECYPELRIDEAAVVSAQRNGMQVILAATTPAEYLRPGMMDVYLENTLFLLDYYSAEVAAVEVPGSVEGDCAYGKPAQEWYPPLLAQAYDAISRQMPRVTVLNGGFGANGSGWFLEHALLATGGPSFDACAMHPVALPMQDLDEFCALYAMNLQATVTACPTEGVWATAFGLPTVSEPVDHEYGRRVLPGDVQAIGSDEALHWYQAVIAELEAAGVAVCCFLARDLLHYRTPHAWCGLRDAAGNDKPWLQSLLLWLQDRPQAQYLIDLPPEEAAIGT